MYKIYLRAIILSLCIPKFTIFPICLKQLFMRPLLDQVTFVEYDNLIAESGIAAEYMSNEKERRRGSYDYCF